LQEVSSGNLQTHHSGDYFHLILDFSGRISHFRLIQLITVSTNLYLKASKQMTISITPNVLVIHLKRFSFGGFSGKINKPVQFDLRLDIPSSATKIDEDTKNIKVADSKKDFNHKMSKKDKRNMNDKIEHTMIPYDLVGVVVHHGSSIHSGHYVAFVKVSVIFFSLILTVENIHMYMVFLYIYMCTYVHVCIHIHRITSWKFNTFGSLCSFR
jgi:hypothetical protein